MKEDESEDVLLDQLRKDIQAGIDQIERGEYTEYDVDNLEPLIEEIMTKGRERLALKRNTNGASS